MIGPAIATARVAGYPALALVWRRHVDLQRVSAALCRP
jgi:hypothetical protein